MNKEFLGFAFTIGPLIFMLVLAPQPSAGVGMVDDFRTEAGYEIFRTEVHPVLKNRCSACHGRGQIPEHAVENPVTAYSNARPYINLQSPELSRIWLRSANNHCGIPSLCGVNDPSLLASIQRWAAVESDVQPIRYSTGVLNVTLPEQVSGISLAEFAGPNGEEYQATITNLGSEVFMFSNIKFRHTESIFGFVGIYLAGQKLVTYSQNFSHFKLIAKPNPTDVWQRMTSEGYVLFQVAPSLTSIEIRMEFDVVSANLTKARAQQLLDEDNYDGVIDQKEFVPKVTAITAGHRHNCALFENQLFKCWGANASGQLGIGSYYSVGARAEQMGANLEYTDLGENVRTKHVSAGRDSTCAVTTEGKVKCWGYNNTGQLGLGDKESRGTRRGQMGDFLPYVNLGTDLRVVQIHQVFDSTCVLFENDSVKCWGQNQSGQLGIGDFRSRGIVPEDMGTNLTFLDVGSQLNIKNMSRGGGHTCAILSNGTAKCWGDNRFGQLGLENNFIYGGDSTTVGDLIPFVKIGSKQGKLLQLASNLNSTCALFESAKVKCWGYNYYGQLGQGHARNLGGQVGDMGDNLAEVNLGEHQNVKKISGTTYSYCALMLNKQVKCWGYNTFGQLGLGDKFWRGIAPEDMGENLPSVDLGTSDTIVDLAVGDRHACVLFGTGRVKCWGNNLYGQLGIGSYDEHGGSPAEMGENLPFLDLGQRFELVL